MRRKTNQSLITNRHDNAPERERLGRLNFRVAIVGTIIAVFAAAGAWWQWWEAHRSRLEEELARAKSERTYLAVDALPWGPNDHVIQPLIDVQINGSGSPARDVAVLCSTSLDLNAPWEQSGLRNYSKFLVITPGKPVHINCGTVHVQPPSLWQNELILGYITYYDVKKNYHQNSPR